MGGKHFFHTLSSSVKNTLRIIKTTSSSLETFLTKHEVQHKTSREKSMLLEMEEGNYLASD